MRSTNSTVYTECWSYWCLSWPGARAPWHSAAYPQSWLNHQVGSRKWAAHPNECGALTIPRPLLECGTWCGPLTA